MLQFRSGQVIANRYTVMSMIGRGGMGCIYRVRDNVLKEDVALKTLLPQHARDKLVVERFFNEAKIARALSHPNIVRVHDIGMTRTENDNIIYISMELIHGQSLRGMLEGLLPGERLPVKVALRVVDELCAALEYAHRHTIHRDIKPENVMICEDETVKLMDFGISKLMDTTGLTGTSIVMGTPFYMSPEQLRNSAGVDVRADIYSIGVMLYEILTGNMPTGVPKPASQLTRDVPPALDPIVAKCVEPDPADRYQSVAELRAALREIMDVLNGTGRGVVRATPKAGLLRGRNVRIGAGILLVAAIMACTVAGLSRFEQYRRQALVATEPVKAPGVNGSATFSAEFAAISDLVARVRAVTPAVAKNEIVQKILSDAEARWEQAVSEKGRDNDKSLELARQALQFYAVPLVWQEGMVFVPAGPVTITDGQTSQTVQADAFFIDENEVSNAQYRQFCLAQNHEHRYDLESAPGDHPVTNVTFYDAQAYAAWTGKTLPTEVQWARAAYGDQASELYPWGGRWMQDACNSDGTFEVDLFEDTAPVGTFHRDITWAGCYDMAGNVSEWTRTICAPLTELPLPKRDAYGEYFGTYLVVRGGHFADKKQTPLSARSFCLFEQYSPALGFRCVTPVPKLASEIEKLLQ